LQQLVIQATEQDWRAEMVLRKAVDEPVWECLKYLFGQNITIE
jgi:hypothetical protein